MDPTDALRLYERLNTDLFDGKMPRCTITCFEEVTYENTGLIEAEVSADLRAVSLWSGLFDHPTWLREVMVLAMIRIVTGDDFGGPRFVRELSRVADRGEAWALGIAWEPP